MEITLRYKTKGTYLLKDLQKVFFCSTEQDYTKYFEEITSDLFELQNNISVWYRDQDLGQIDDEGKEQYLSDLSRMDLFVVPVTGEFLRTENTARKLELAFAMRENIPILPLLEEQGLEMLFNEVCGNLQILNKYDPDPTALPYKDKLKLFLDTILLKDEVIEKIRQAFAAYIFLSYRKKDRRYAQEVMRMIHKESFTRDIAIWYDEFLTPGEDFNESIRQAFEKSDLFSMVVTPNLLEKPNYVMTTEYPMAVKAEKKILPIAAADAEMETLKKYYPGIPEPIKDPDRVGKWIREALNVKTNDDPRHKFFIGLAYLSGIDTETDHEKARVLITDAAEGGIEEAYRKLVSMYETGQGVRRDHEQSAHWQERYADYLEKKLTDGDNGEDLLFRYIRAVNAASKKWADLLRYERCWKLLEKMLSLDLMGMTDHEKIALAESFQFAAEIAVRQNDLSGARAYLKKMLEIADSFISSLSENEDKKKTQYTALLSALYRGVGLNILGDIETKQENREEAVRCYEEAEPLIRRVFASNPANNKGLAKELVGLYGKIANAYFTADNNSSDNLRKAERKCRETLLYVQGLRNQLGEFVQGPYTFRVYETLINTYIRLKNNYAARNTADEFVALAEKEHESVGDISSARILAFAHVCRATVAEDRKDYTKAEAEIRSAVEVENALNEKIGIIHTEKQLKAYYQILIKYAGERGDEKKAAFYADNIRFVEAQVAMKYYRDAEKGNITAAGKAYELYQELYKKYPERDYGKYAAYVKNHFLKQKV